MIKKLQTIAIAALAAAAALAFSSCADPYYTTGYGASYGYGHGYGGATFSSATFIATGDPRWGYDPHVRAYYDYGRRAYYDPYLYGYYPVGYRPVIVRTAPHPYGWRPGRPRIAPPPRVRTVTLRDRDFRDREGAYRRSGQPWARDIQRPRPRGTAAPRRTVTAPRPEYRDRPTWSPRATSPRAAAPPRTAAAPRTAAPPRRTVTAPRPEDRDRPVWASTRAPTEDRRTRRGTWRAGRGTR